MKLIDEKSADAGGAVEMNDQQRSRKSGPHEPEREPSFALDEAPAGRGSESKKGGRSAGPVTSRDNSKSPSPVSSPRGMTQAGSKEQGAFSLLFGRKATQQKEEGAARDEKRHDDAFRYGLSC